MNYGDLSKKERTNLKHLPSLNFSTTPAGTSGTREWRVCVWAALLQIQISGLFAQIVQVLLSYMNSICCTITAQFQLAVQLDYLIKHPVGLGAN